ncbi:unnamed protein product [Mytilus coruscus]|uniref:Uncharacterized protein n=1 Tax=Mytilus coruscus TaxID=42192 RepID=A0A6J8EWL0_MYTCO|nr:unnamed protein product [Mytilus coruscus]
MQRTENGTKMFSREEWLSPSQILSLFANNVKLGSPVLIKSEISEDDEEIYSVLQEIETIEYHNEISELNNFESHVSILLDAIAATITLIRYTNDQKDSFHSKEDILRISDQLEMLSAKMKSYCSPTVEPKKYENVYNDYPYYVLKDENRRLKYKPQKEKEKSEKVADSLTRADANKKRKQRKESQESLEVGCRSVQNNGRLFM